ncbi:MAG: hypothetical protein IAE97_07415 [Chthoniobacterales bacterium]|nr:hypothetical protein [Chthoniobacterales bacterium]
MNEIHDRLAHFAEKWEEAEAKSFWGELFTTYGVDRQQVVTPLAPTTKTLKTKRK